MRYFDRSRHSPVRPPGALGSPLHGPPAPKKSRQQIIEEHVAKQERRREAQRKAHAAELAKQQFRVRMSGARRAQLEEIRKQFEESACIQVDLTTTLIVGAMMLERAVRREAPAGWTEILAWVKEIKAERPKRGRPPATEGPAFWKRMKRLQEQWQQNLDLAHPLPPERVFNPEDLEDFLKHSEVEILDENLRE